MRWLIFTKHWVADGNSITLASDNSFIIKGGINFIPPFLFNINKFFQE